MSNGKQVEEEDIDDLDDVLEQFSHPRSGPASNSRPTASSTSQQELNEILSEDFANHLAAEMEAMMRQLNGEGSSAPPGSDVKTQGADGKSKAEGSRAAEEQHVSEDEPFQRAIRQAMEKLQQSDDTLKDSGAGDETLEKLLSSIKDLKLQGEDEDKSGGEDFESMLETLMSQLMSKEILYEPLKELDTKYPEYLSKNSSTIPSEDLDRYTKQMSRVSEIVTLFESPSYSDGSPEQSAEVLRLMNEMQSFGSPPADIMGAVPPGFELGADGLPNVPEGCTIA